ncbi:opine dehydrogenase-like isoform X1 [Mytilus galloprovincialis]|uniref:opine dehydrogenase-like isoform X1 n=1 Tax=Mytilus galloprovincialis TaxID=29158 RepID=UPI003F7B702B
MLSKRVTEIMPAGPVKRRILICGGGNGAHCLSALAASRENLDVNVLTLFQDEAERWTKLLEDNDLKISVTYNDSTESEILSKPSIITKDPAKAVEGVDIVFLVVPAFAHAQYFTTITPYLQPNTLIVGLPGQAGFEFQCRSMLGKKARTCTIASLESLPWACRILEFGKHVQILGFKESLGMSFLTGSECNLLFPVVETVQEVLGEKPHIQVIENYIAVNLMAKSIIHPPLLYGKWGDWDGTPVPEKPLFYQGVDEIQAELLSKVSDEVLATAKELAKLRNGCDMSEVIHIFDWYKIYYKDQVADKSSLMMAMRTNKAYDGLVHPMTPTEDGKFVPDFNYRYTSEDVPFGLVVMKGIAEIAGVETPTIDKIIAWAQTKLDKEYIVGSKLTGKDIASARAPQSYGLHTIDELFNM